MKAFSRRTLLMAFCVLCIVQEAGTIPLSLRYVGYAGAYPNGRTAPFYWRLEALPRYAGAEAGLRSGDILDAKALTSAQRFRLWSGAPVAGRPEPFPVVRNGSLKRIIVTPPVFPMTWALWVAILAGFWSALCAIVLLMRRGNDRGVQMLVLYLLMVRLSIQMAPENWVTPYPIADLINATINVIMPLGWALLAAYSVEFVASNAATRSLAIVSYALGAYVVTISVLAVLGSWFGFVDPLAPLFAGVPYAIAQIAYFFAPLCCAIAALRSARGTDRVRLAWLLGPTAVIYLIYLSYLASSYYPVLDGQLFQTISLVLQLLAPLGITYAMLNRRLLDIGFVLNRAVVYTGVSVVVVGIFMLVEWAFGEWFTSATHLENLLASAGLALVLGFSVRAIHERVDNVLDRAFFRKRHEDEAALRQFAREAPYITESATLLRRTQETLGQHADASFVIVALDDGSGHFGDVSENDPALVTLRASREVVDLAAIHSALQGEFAYPMIARGRILGALAIGPKRSGEPYAPDESDAISELAHGVATSLDVITLSSNRHDDAILDGIKELRRAITSLADQIERKQEASI